MLLSKKNTIHIVQLLCITLLPVFFVLLPFVLKLDHFLWLDMRGGGLQKIYGSWDGPNYILNAIGLYDPIETGKHLFIRQSTEYYAAHFPLFSLIIRWIHTMIPWLHYPAAGMVANMGISLGLNAYFFHLVEKKTKHPYWLTFLFTVFPPRQLVLRTIISPEVLVSLCIVATIVFWDARKYWLSALFGFLAVTTKFQALVLVPTLGLSIFLHLLQEKKLPNYKALLVPAVILSAFCFVSLWYWFVIGNFWAYFRAQDIVGMHASLPFAMFDYLSPWVQTGYLEDVVFYFIAALLLIVQLFKTKEISSALFCTIYTVLLALLPQRDIARIAYPLVPFFFFAFHRYLTAKPVRYVLLATLPIVILYSINFILHNQAPVADWGLLR